MSYRMPYGYRDRMAPRRGSFMGPRLWIGAALVAFAFISYQCSSEYNPVTGEEQHIALAPQQEIALGLQALPEMMAQYGGEHPDADAQALVDRVGQRIVAQSAAAGTDWQFDFHLLADPQVVNAFALPGGRCSSRPHCSRSCSRRASSPESSGTKWGTWWHGTRRNASPRSSSRRASWAPCSWPRAAVAKPSWRR